MPTTAAPRLIFAVNLQEARETWQGRDPHESLTIYVQNLDYFYASTESRDSMDGIRSRLLESGYEPSQAAAVVFLYSDRAELQCLAIQGDERRLNRQDCLGKSLRYLDSEVASPRVVAIQQAITSGQVAEYLYTHYWEDLTWHFRGVVRHFPDYGEILVEIFDEAEWQATWWQQRD